MKFSEEKDYSKFTINQLKMLETSKELDGSYRI